MNLDWSFLKIRPGNPGKVMEFQDQTSVETM